MEHLLHKLASHIKESMPSLSLVDEDYGQLEALDKDNIDMYPLTFPAVLIDAPECDWSGIAGKSQKGTAKVGVKLIIDCYDDTHYASGTTDAILARAGMVASSTGCCKASALPMKGDWTARSHGSTHGTMA